LADLPDDWGFSIVNQEVPMIHEKMSPLCQRMIEDMHIREINNAR
jgi:hypothetical protein